MIFWKFFSKHKKNILIIISIVVIIFIVSYFLFLQTPLNFIPETVITVSPGENLLSIAEDLQAQHIVSYRDLFMDLVILQGGEHKVLSGDYIFHSREDIFLVSRRFVVGDFEITPVKVTIPEGSTVYNIVEILSEKFSNFNPITFLQIAKGEEGYLFPDTYFIFPNTKPEDIVSMMR